MNKESEDKLMKGVLIWYAVYISGKVREKLLSSNDEITANKLFSDIYEPEVSQLIRLIGDPLRAYMNGASLDVSAKKAAVLNIKVLASGLLSKEEIAYYWVDICRESLCDRFSAKLKKLGEIVMGLTEETMDKPAKRPVPARPKTARPSARA